ncbi:hypothetical protein BC939DRAFT_498567 [Gamsiella multidivaricata]|uniref:uncharacterized protein n=1 Tax=Gamsiella multidivaricata TaxID=101098 RepID=UPI002220D8D3|nr:uncharacterized protein BC939DRAFT_498567 [Gamsiella multidivaricata]KAG0354220.1 hypothetical protein BGZ54_001741 [Gamsiella multidivaricata]KAI7832496.1 hypothetical protein BC939DRAFT_498567 [Gamsiella multidivaricata]
MSPLPNSPLKRPYPSATVFEGTEIGHELDYIPYAKASKTFVKQTGYSTNTSPEYQDQWLSTHPDDAKVPRMGEAENEDHSSLSTNRRFSGVGTASENTGGSIHPSMSQSPVSAVPSHQEFGNPSELNSLYPINMGAGSHQTLRQRQLQYQQQLQQLQQQYQKQQCRYQHDQQEQQASETEVVLEMPPPALGNRKPRNMRRSSNLNNKYARMKRDMELMVHGRTPKLRAQYGRSFVEYVPVLYYEPTTCSQDPGAPFADAYGSGALPTSSPTARTTLPPSSYHVTQSVTQPSTTKPIQRSPSLSSGKRVRFDEVVPQVTPGSVSNANLSGGGGAYSTPHFRLSSGSSLSSSGRAVGNNYVPYSEPGRQFHDDGFGDDSEFENLLLDQDPFLDGISPVEPFREAVMTTDYMPPVLPRPQPLSKATFDTAYQQMNRATDLSVGQPYHHAPRPESILDDRSLAITERIHKIGSAIRASAAVNISRFGEKLPPSMDIRRGRDPEQEREQQRIRQQSRFAHPRPSSPSQPKSVFANSVVVPHSDIAITSMDHTASTGTEEPVREDKKHAASTTNPASHGVHDIWANDAKVANTIIAQSDTALTTPTTPTTLTDGIAKKSSNGNAVQNNSKITVSLLHQLPAVGENVPLSTSVVPSRDRIRSSNDAITTFVTTERDFDENYITVLEKEIEDLADL